MENERQLKLQETLKAFNKKHKIDVFKMGSSIENYGVIPSGIPSFDAWLNGGFKRGAHCIIAGDYSVGKTALVLTTIANIQKSGQVCCYVNLEKPINVERFEFFGIDLSQLVYVEAIDHAETALESMRTLCKEKVVDVFIIDSIQGLCPKATVEDDKGNERSLEKRNVAALPLLLSNFYNQVNAHVFNSKAAVLWVSQLRTQGIGSYFVKQGTSGGRAQDYFAYHKIIMNRDQKSNNPTRKIKEYFLDPEGKVHFQTVEEEVGFSIKLKLEKSNSGNEKSEIYLNYYKDTGFKPLPEQELEIRIALDQTPEQIEIINKYLIEKGIIKDSEPTIAEQQTEPQVEQTQQEEPKKRGRKKKE